MAKKTTRVQIELPEKSMARLRGLKEETEAGSYADVTRNAYQLYEKMIRLNKEGYELVIRKDGGEKILELFY